MKNMQNFDESEQVCDEIKDWFTFFIEQLEEYDVPILNKNFESIEKENRINMKVAVICESINEPKKCLWDLRNLISNEIYVFVNFLDCHFRNRNFNYTIDIKEEIFKIDIVAE